MKNEPIAYSSLSILAQRLASVLSCITTTTNHAMDCRVLADDGRDTERCQLCLDLTSADEILAEVDFDA